MDSSDITMDGLGYSEALGADFSAEGSDTSASGAEAAAPQPETAVVNEPAAGVEAPVTQAPETQPTWNPEGPGDIREALRQERENARRYQEQVAQYQAILEAQAQAQGQVAMQEPEIDVLDPEAFAYQQQELAAVRQEVVRAQQDTRVEMSEAFARQSYPDYDATVASLQPYVAQGVVSLDAIWASPNPAQLAYQLGKQFQGSDPGYIEAEVQRRLAQLAPRLTPQSPQAPRGLGTLPPAAPNTDAKGDPSRISAATVAKMSGSEREDWYRRALSGG